MYTWILNCLNLSIFVCFSNLLVSGELTLIVSLSAEIGIPFKISHVYLGNLKYVMEKNQQFGTNSLGQKKNSCVSGSLPEKNRVGR